MRATFHLKTLAVAIATLSVASMTNAAGLDRSGQDITAFLQDGTYAEAVYTYIDADVTGNDNAYVGTSDTAYVKGKATGDIAESYDFFRYGVKTDINDTFSVGILYDVLLLLILEITILQALQLQQLMVLLHNS